MKIELQLPERPRRPFRMRDCDPKLDNIRSRLCEACAFAQPEGTFVVSGFGDDRWPVDVRTDLAIVSEQAPAALLAIETRAPFEIDWYEQGLERKVVFNSEEVRYTATCLSYGRWDPDRVVEYLDPTEIARMLTAV